MFAWSSMKQVQYSETTHRQYFNYRGNVRMYVREFEKYWRQQKTYPCVYLFFVALEKVTSDIAV